MKQFKGPKYQQGKFGGDPYDHTDDIEHLKTLIKKCEVTQVTIGEEAMMYVYVPKAISYTQREQRNIRDRIVEAFGNVYPDTPIYMGWVRMEFSEIEEKDVFLGKLKGDVL